ncbi:glycosyltransferase family 39 protein [Limnospira fusiformis KN01]|uniref:ArnT family glycosyltransferase n=1 Tax=Limnospira TaxID=2596745 RepID=UPI001658AF70|nr:MULTISPECIES: glycosyltransferase family 39 protein [Limnospira]MDT9196871.1 glycosyltransferase family 39 protein [Limnospira sp. PMC 1042.18]ULB44639.1 glycosyltransferase family 39 protein [Limnospira fusiformis KN01]
MSAILILLTLIFLFLIFRQTGQGWRSGILSTGLTWGTLVVLITEVLGLFGSLKFTPLFMVLIIVNLILGFTVIKILIKGQIRWVNWQFYDISVFIKLAIASVTVIILIIGLTAAIAPPNNWDSMTYHMSRVVHWMQNGSVNHYPTSITRQISLGPWSGFAVTNLQILSGGDRLANFVQWASMVGSIVGISLVAKQLGGGLRSQVFSAVFCATIPMGILQASSTQTDYVGAFWMVTFVYYTLLSIQDKKRVSYPLAIGASLGLAVLTKGTAYFYLFPFGLWFGLVSIQQCGWKVSRHFIVIGVIALAINLGHFQRNYEVFGSILGTSGDYKLEIFSIPILISNTIRNIALHFSTFSRDINLLLIKIIAAVHKFIEVDINDPRTTFPPGQNFDVHTLINHEDLAGNTIHIVLFMCLSILFIIKSHKFTKPHRYYLAIYMLSIIVSFLLFCSLIAWSPWRSRLHLPIFVLSSAFIGVMMDKLLQPKIANSVAIIMIIASGFFLMFNESRPLIFNSKIFLENQVNNLWNLSRQDQYFINIPELQAPYSQSVDFVLTENCTDVGLIIGGDTWEYPFWVLFKQKSDRPITLRHIMIDNESAIKANISPHQDFSPCAIIASGVAEMNNPEIIIDQQVYQPQWSKEMVTVFLKQN